MPVQDEVPKSRTTIVYKTEVDGQPADVELPLRLMITGDFSLGTSTDRQVDLSERAPRNLNGSNLGDVMRDMKISVDMVIPNKINPDVQESLRVTLPIHNVDSFSPHEVAKKIPQIRSLLLLKKLLEEMQSNIANKKEFAQLLNKVYSNPESLAKLREELKLLAPVLPKPPREETE